MSKADLQTADGERVLLVAVVPRAGCVGWVGVSQRRALTSVAAATIEGLVVEDEFRSSGIGAMLVAEAEVWARRRGCTTVRVLSNVVRKRAHDFYRKLGYEVVKSEVVFEKPL